MQPGDVALRIEPGRHLALRDGVVFAVQHVFFTRPDHLDGRAGHFFGNRHGLAYIVGLAAPAKATAQMQFVYVALRRGKARGFSAGGQCCLAILRGAPHLAAAGRPFRRGVHGLHGGVVLKRVRVHRFNFAGARGNRCLGIAVFIAHNGLWGVQTRFQKSGDAGTVDFFIRPVVPNNRQCVKRGFGPPPGVGHHGHGAVAHTHDFLDARAFFNRRCVKTFELAAKHRAILDGGVQHTGQHQVTGVNLLACGLVNGVEPRQALACQLPVFRVFERDGGRWRDFGGCQRNLAVACLAA